MRNQEVISKFVTLQNQQLQQMYAQQATSCSITILVSLNVTKVRLSWMLHVIPQPHQRYSVIKAIRVNQKTGCVDFKWHGVDACLWMGVNCVETKKRKVLNK